MRSKQQGYVLLVILALMMAGGAGYFVSTVNETAIQSEAGRNKDILKQLRNARDRLLTYAATHPEVYGDTTPTPGPGYFPCPDQDNNRWTDGSCSDEVAIGRLPEKIGSRGVNFLPEGLDRQLVWYALDSNYSYQGGDSRCDAPMSNKDPIDRCEPLNHDAPSSRITLNGKSDYVALLFYAGMAQGGQDRGTSNDVTDFLDGGNADGDGDFFSVQAGNDINDLVVGITKAEWLALMRKRLVQDISDNGGCDGGLADTDHWFSRNQWADDSVISGRCNGGSDPDPDPDDSEKSESSEKSGKKNGKGNNGKHNGW
ncbi:hypothetical protein [Marinobacterium arenosum]|uniref:hypothetical protein n=1 Tax=Marinobacterium arenosum TaxID=2862496 RepID=UPI001C949EF6|nr:hypothetical protein [Marinobacterium arenosum]MBY4676525.1 hypothetical protein [Marinobacterium arenosum]